MAVEAAANRLEALVEKINSDINYAVLKLSVEFSECFEDDLPNECNPVELIERLKKAKQECEMLLRKMDEVESKEKVMMPELCRLMPEQAKKVQGLQSHSGMQPSSTNTDNGDLVILHQECGRTDNAQETECRSGSNDFLPVTEEEFTSVSDLVRGRSKLDDINKVYNALFSYFQKNRKARSITLKEMTKLGLKVSGATGSAKLKVLRTLNIIEIGKDGSVKVL